LNHDQATEDVRELAALYALGSLTQHEARSFEMHLREGCAVCEAELHRFERTASGIGFAVGEAETPEYLRELLLARIEREPQETPAEAVQLQKEPPPREIPSPPPMAQSILFGSQRSTPRGFPWKVAALLVAIVALGATLYALRSARATNDKLQAKVSTIQADLDNLNVLLDSQEEKAGRLDKLLAMVGRPGVRIARFVEQTPSRASLGAILCDMEQNQCLLFGFFPAASPQKTYQLWLITSKARVSLGPVHPDPAGRVYAEAAVPGEAADASLAALTLEPDGGSQTPTMPFYAIGRFD
jgi:anti-sigma-K factor RskA